MYVLSLYHGSALPFSFFDLFVIVTGCRYIGDNIRAIFLSLLIFIRSYIRTVRIVDWMLLRDDKYSLSVVTVCHEQTAQPNSRNSVETYNSQLKTVECKGQPTVWLLDPYTLSYNANPLKSMLSETLITHLSHLNELFFECREMQFFIVLVFCSTFKFPNGTEINK